MKEDGSVNAGQSPIGILYWKQSCEGGFYSADFCSQISYMKINY